MFTPFRGNFRRVSGENFQVYSIFLFQAINRLSKWTLTTRWNEWKDLAIGDEDYREIYKCYMDVQKEHKEARTQIRGSSCADPEIGTGGLDSTEK